MRVLIANDCPPGLSGSGGVETHVRQLKEALGARGIDTAILASQVRGFPERREKGLFLIPELIVPPLRKNFLRNSRQQQAALKKAAGIIREFNPDVIHIHNMMNPRALRMLRRCGRPVVKSIHDCRPFCVKPSPAVASRLIGDSQEFCDISFGLPCWCRCYACSGHSVMERIDAWSFFPANLRALREIKQMDQMVVYSQYLKDLALRKMTDAQRIHIVYHFTDAEFASASAKIPAKPAGDPVFLFSGRLSPEKGIMHIFQALERIPDVSCKLIIAGDGPLREAVEQCIPSCSPRHKIEVKGFVDQAQLYELYRESSVLLFPSIGSEGCPLVGIEAMYFGTPAIGYDTGGAGEWLVDGRTGILLPRGDIGGLARAMAELAADPDRTARLGAQARDYVSQKFQREKHISQLVDIYKQAIQDKGKQVS